MKNFQSAWYRSTRRAAAIAAVGFGLGIVTGTAQAACVGDCDANGEVTVTDLIKMVNISLETAPLTGCQVGDANNDGAITVNEIIAGVNNSLTGCPAGATCGNNAKEPGEDCDDGGVCMGGSNAGTSCTKESDCQGEGVCDAFGIPGGGLRKICSTDADCGSAKCVRCQPFGGDGCAANCTTETTINNTLKPGAIDGTDIAPGTSGASLFADILSLPLPLNGQNNLIVGKEKDGRIPVAQKPDGVILPRIPVSTLACACVRGIVYKTCGGAQYEADGETESPDCSRDESVCTGKKPCTSLAGPGNNGIGTIGCQSLPSVSYSVEQDACGVKKGADCLFTCGGEELAADGTPAQECTDDGDCSAGLRCLNVPGPAKFSYTGGGGAGSMLLANSTAIATVVGACSGNGGAYGPDGEFCTGDDTPTATSPGDPSITTLTTGSATGKLLNANGIEGNDIEPPMISGAIVSCQQVGSGGGTSGSSLVGSFTATGGETTGDYVVTDAFVSQ